MNENVLKGKLPLNRPKVNVLNATSVNGSAIKNVWKG